MSKHSGVWVIKTSFEMKGDAEVHEGDTIQADLDMVTGELSIEVTSPTGDYHKEVEAKGLDLSDL